MFDISGVLGKIVDESGKQVLSANVSLDGKPVELKPKTSVFRKLLPTGNHKIEV